MPRQWQNHYHMEILWLNPSYITNDFIKDYDNDGEDCYILETDLTYTKELHDKHNDYPLAPELTYVKVNSLSPYQVELYKKLINPCLKRLIH